MRNLWLAILVLLSGLSMAMSFGQNQVDYELLTLKLRSEEIPQQNAVFRTKSRFREFILMYANGDALDVDFERNSVIGIFLGERPNPGFGLEIRRIVSGENGTLIVEYTETTPDPEAGIVQVVVYPYLLLSIPKTEEQIRFNRISVK